MNKKYLNILLTVASFLLIIICLQNSSVISKSVLESSIIFITKVFPFLFIMMMINSILICANFPYLLSKIIANPYVYIFIMSALSGSPVNAIIIRDFIKKKIITEKQASIAISFTTLNNPLFLYNYINLIFKNQYITIKLLSIIYISNISLLIWYSYKEKNSKYILPYNKTNIQKDFINSFTSTINNLINIFAIITFFKLICDLLITSTTPLSSLIKGLIEITQGLNDISLASYISIIKELLLIVILSFAGFSIHIQISNILNDYNVNYKYFYYSRLVLIIIGTILVIMF
ncbi:MAG: hypothetical protein E7167_03870 [Firmicutes bacterium]|nr:hypothetical protein [Bacillota bacterium]